MKSKIIEITTADGRIRYVGMLKTGWFCWEYLSSVFLWDNSYYTYSSLSNVHAESYFDTVAAARRHLDNAIKIKNRRVITSIQEVVEKD